MSNRCNLFIAVTSLLVLTCYSAKDLSPEKLSKNYAKIDKYLEKNVQSDNPKINLAAAVELQHAKSSKLFSIGEKSLIDTIDLLQQFAALYTLNYICNTSKRREMMNLVDAGLALGSRSKTPEHPLTRVERIIQHYAFEDARRCGYTSRFLKLEYGYKQIAYDSINSLLEKALPEVEDVAANMAKAEELLNGMADGALADALKQLLQLKLTLSDDSCGEKGYEILLKNDLATRLEDIKRDTEKLALRVNNIVQYYARKHEQICRPVVPDLIKSALLTLDRDSYRIVLGLVTAYFSDNNDYGKLAEELSEKQADENFSTPSLVKLATRKFDEFQIKANFQRLNSEIDPKTLYYYVIAASAEDPLSKFICGTKVENAKYVGPYQTSKKVFDEDKLKMLLAKYLFDPCSRFLNIVGGIVRASYYRTNLNSSYIGGLSNEFIKEISYHTSRAGYLACRYVVDKQEEVMLSIMATSRKNKCPFT